MSYDTFEYQAFFSTVQIKTFPASGGVHSGTGFLVVARLPDPTDGGVVLLVSNKHVFGDPNCRIELTFHRKDPTTRRPCLGYTITFRFDSFQPAYTDHPDNDVDLACINVADIVHKQPEIFSKHLLVDMFASPPENQLLPGADVYIVGYPSGQLDHVHNLPIMRRGCLATLPEVDFEGRPEFLVDAGVFPGSSGSPVFARFGTEARLVGVIAKTFIRELDVQTKTGPSGLFVQSFIGLGVAVKYRKLKELIDLVLTKVRPIGQLSAAQKL